MPHSARYELLMKKFPEIRRMTSVAAMLFAGATAGFPAGQSAAVEDVFQVMERVSAEGVKSARPDFDVSDIPVLVYDGLNTYLFQSKTAPDGFTKTNENSPAFSFPGQHPLVRGNSIVRIGDSWTATSVLSRTSRRTGETYDVRDMAGIIVHEQFHVFLRIRHPRWRQNDGVLLFYPAETAEALFLRRREKEAFRRAVMAPDKNERAAWAKRALSCREERLAGLEPQFSVYEKELQRTEGLSDYIERTVRGLDPLNASTITNGIAPAGVRDLGYVEGRWMAMILDRLDPGWKSVLEENDSLYLEDILKSAVDRISVDAERFASDDIDRLKIQAGEDIEVWEGKKKKEVEAFDRRTGFRVELDASSNPLAIRLFEPLEMEILEDGGVYHRMVFSAAGESGSLRIMDQSCLTYFDPGCRLTRLIITGLKTAPEIADNEMVVRITGDGVDLELKYMTAVERGGVYTIKL